ncbi:RNA polymerase sigma factor [Massilibacteroides sp.]|uniref:RNA polymerase sigma factor n=1 Tax=Massilibacteroides sp. TaxID=2034766 RepID=UPI00260A50EC|nr:RNA polymerase sigma factor [Massilibacteroides sp.]MDD4514723.1 RNA polymerase sigma factor [Massilibacteroides sp.]
MDEGSFKQQFLPLHPKLYRIAFAITGNTEDAEDILQEAYCKLWDKREELTIIRSAEAFCITLVRNMCLDYLRSAKRNIGQDEVNDQIFVSTSSPENELIEQDRTRVIKKLINELPDNQRQVILLSGIEGCTAEEIEHITGLSAINIRVLLSRARKTVREKFNKVMSYER